MELPQSRVWRFILLGSGPVTYHRLILPRKPLSAMFLCLVQLISMSALSGVLAAVMSISRTWDGHFYGEFKLSAMTATDDWRVHLIFSVPISNLQSDDNFYVAHVRDGTEWSVSGKHSWSQLGDDQYVPISIEGDYDFYDADEEGIWGTALVENPSGEDYGYSQVVPAIFISTSSQPDFTTQTLPEVSPTTFSGSSVPVATPAPPSTTGSFPEVTESNDLSPSTTRPSPEPTTAAAQTTASFIASGSSSCQKLVKVIRPPGAKMKYDYPTALAYSILFYEAQRSGDLPENSRVPWRGDSALEDGEEDGVDLSGGWYDAGDNVKFGFPMASSTSLLLWGLLQWEDAYVATGQLEYMYDSVKWPLDYFIKCHTSAEELYVQVGDAELDHQYWGRPEDMYMDRPSFKINATYPGSDVAAETAAAMALGSIVFRKRDSAYADRLLSHAEELYEFANKYRGIYTDSVPEASIFYESSHYFDELAWAACWLYKATWKEKYLTYAVDLYPVAVNVLPWAFSWDDKRVGVQALLWNFTQDAKYQYDIEYALRKWLPGGRWNYTTKGLAYLHRWGTLRYAENGAFIALIVADYGLSPDTYRPWAMAEMNYALGDSGRSFVVGFGENSPKNPHHRASSCPDMPASCGWETFNTTRDNPQTLCGALVGGPDENDFYKDDRKDYVSSEVACDYNAGYQSALAGLIHLSMSNQLPAF